MLSTPVPLAAISAPGEKFSGVRGTKISSPGIAKRCLPSQRCAFVVRSTRFLLDQPVEWSKTPFQWHPLLFPGFCFPFEVNQQSYRQASFVLPGKPLSNTNLEMAFSAKCVTPQRRMLHMPTRLYSVSIRAALASRKLGLATRKRAKRWLQLRGRKPQSFFH